MKIKTALFILAASVMLLTGIYFYQAKPVQAAEEHGHEEEGHGEEGTIDLTVEQIKAAGIETSTIGAGKVSREIKVPGRIVAAADRMAKIVPKISGVVTEAKKNLGDVVEKDEVMAIIESREMAEAAADYLAAKRGQELTATTFKREKDLWEKKITAEQDYLNARNANQEAQIRLDLARQKLKALGQSETAASDKLRFYELKAPIKGKVIARELTLGEYVDTTHTAFEVADLGVVWVETAIAPGDLSYIQEGQQVTITAAHDLDTGKLIFISPVIDSETRSAKAIIELDNTNGHWRAGDFVSAAITTSVQEAGLIVPKDAIQNHQGKNIVFVRNEHGFERRQVTLGKQDSNSIEVLNGLKTGETIATKNTFTLKAELGKAEAEHSH